MHNIRHEEILKILERNGAVSVKALCEILYVSEATVRRDLAELERMGALKRTFGGAVPIINTKNQIPLFMRESLDSDAKSLMCKAAAELVGEGDCIFADGSSTVQYLAKHIANIPNITVVTYSIKTAEIMCENHIRTYCTGGLLMENSRVCVGQSAIDFAQKVNFDICFISCLGLNEDGRFTDTSAEETAVRRAFMNVSKTRAMLMTGNKIGKTYFHTLCDTSEIDYLFSDLPTPDWLKLREPIKDRRILAKT